MTTELTALVWLADVCMRAAAAAAAAAAAVAAAAAAELSMNLYAVAPATGCEMRTGHRSRLP